MSDLYEQLLEATIQHLRQLKARGVRFIPVQPATLALLKQKALNGLLEPAMQKIVVTVMRDVPA